LAAAVAMIQVNLLLPTDGRASDSFVMNDLMRLPLGILTGVGFIGGGVILRRDDIIVGVTTAATLWLATVIGLCLGGGQIILGLAVSALGLAVLWPLQWIETRLPREHRARIAIELDAKGPGVAEMRRRIGAAGLSIVASRIEVHVSGETRRIEMELRRVRSAHEIETPALIEELTRTPGIVNVSWRE
jgi:putative Mg2+ transporter-C (MgtC) family protein